MFNFDIKTIDYSNQICFQSNHDHIPSFVYSYLEEIKNELTLKNFNNNLNNLLFMCEVLIEYSWEMLSTNLWCFVDKIWRQIYGYSILYKVLILSYKNEHNENLIKLCDLG